MHNNILAAAAAAIVLASAPMARAAEEEAAIALPAVSINFTPNYIADAMGFWKEQGLAVKLTQLGGIQAMNAMLSGSVEFSNSSVATIIRANIRGQKVLAVGTALDGIMQELVLSNAAAKAAGVTETSDIKAKAAALKGKKMHPARMQMDWMRYWTMRAPNERSVKAPQFELSTYNGAC